MCEMFYNFLSADDNAKYLFEVNERCGFYELCREFVSFAKRGEYLGIEKNGQLRVFYSADAIRALAVQVKRFAERHKIMDLNRLLNLVAEYYSKTIINHDKERCYEYISVRQSEEALNGYEYLTVNMLIIHCWETISYKIIETVTKKLVQSSCYRLADEPLNVNGVN